MSIEIYINSGGEDRELLSEGVHQAVIADVVDLGLLPVPAAFGGGERRKVQLVYISDEADSAGRTKYVFERLTASLHEKATLRKRVKQITGSDITGKSYDVETLIGRQCQLVIQHNEALDGSGKIYANVSSATKPAPKQRIEIPADFVRRKDKPEKANGGAAPKANGRAVAAAVLAPPRPAITNDDIPF